MDVPKKAEQYYNYLTEELSDDLNGLEYLTQKRRKKHTIYFKGLVERKDTMLEGKKGRRQKRISEDSIQNSANKKAKELNKGIESSEECLVELIDKIVLLHEEFQEKKGIHILFLHTITKINSE